MATKKTTSKAKTKTAKAVKTTKKTVATKVTKTVAVAKSVNLQRLNLLSVLVFVILAGLAATLMASTNYEITINYLTPDAINQSIVPAYRHLIDIDLRWLLVAVLGLSAIGPLMHSTRMKQTYANSVKSKVMSWRWVEWSVITALVMAAVALLAGYQDLATIKLFGIAILVIGLLSWCAERETSQNDNKTARASHMAAILIATSLVILIGLSFVATLVYGHVRAAWYVYATFGVLVASLVLNSLNQHKQIRANKAWKNYEIIERNYLIIGLISKIALAAVLIAGLAK